MSSTRSYEVEDRVFSGRFLRSFLRDEGMTVADQQAVADQIYEWAITGTLWSTRGAALNWMNIQQFLRLINAGRITLQRSRGVPDISSYAYADRYHIFIGAKCGPAMVCHEVAHILTPHESGHGSAWRQAYVECVRVVLGDFHANRLSKAFAAEYKPGRHRAVARRRRA